MEDDGQNVQTVELNSDNQPAKPPVDTSTSQPDHRLSHVRNEALKALVPIMDNLRENDPERKFDMCMNAMRLTNDQALAETALKTALTIQDAGTRAEALVELINEIDYQQQAVGTPIKG